MDRKRKEIIYKVDYDLNDPIMKQIEWAENSIRRFEQAKNKGEIKKGQLILYKTIIDNTLNYLNNIDNKYKRHFIIETDIIPLLTKDFYSRFAIDLLTLFLSQSINYKKLNDTQLKSHENTLDKIYNNISNIEDVTLKIYKLRKTINLLSHFLCRYIIFA